MADWIASDTFAVIVGISERKARSALERVFSGKSTSWRGASLIVREVPSRGGRSGMRYQVRVDSLPVDIRSRFEELSKEPCGLISHSLKAQREREDWFHVIKPLIELDDPLQRSVARAALIDEIAAKEHRIDGQTIKVTVRTIRRKLEAYRKNGLSGLSKDKRNDAGKSRVIVTRLWDQAVPFDDETKEAVAEEFLRYMRRLVAGPAQTSNAQDLASYKLQGLTTARAFDPGSEELKRICQVPRYMIEREKQFKQIHLYNHDRKAYDDAKPRIRRTRKGLLPMDIIVADIHPVDILCRRADGSTATPRAIAWLDVATNRIWITLVLLEKGEGIRNVDVIDSFREMVSEWGLPRKLYMDNGSEYNWADFVDDGLKLVLPNGSRITYEYGTRKVSNIVRAKPYNAAAKPIEGIFAVLEKNFFSLITGWIGGDRMKKKTANVGREPTPYPGSFEELKRDIADVLRWYDIKPQTGEFKGISPSELWTRAVAEGWQRVDVDERVLLLAFSEEKPRKVRQGAIRCNGWYWTAPELRRYQGDMVSVRIPKYHHWTKLPVYDEKGELLCFAEPDTQYDFMDPLGAIEAAQRSREHKQGLDELSRKTPKLNMLQEVRKRIAAAPPVPLPAPSGRIGGSEKAEELVALLSEPEDMRHAREQRKLIEKNENFLKLTRTFRRSGTRG